MQVCIDRYTLPSYSFLKTYKHDYKKEDISDNYSLEFSEFRNSSIKELHIKSKHTLDAETINKMKELEQQYWHFIDNKSYYPNNRPNFMEYLQLFHDSSKECLSKYGINQIPELCKLYNKYKKTLPTAGILILHRGIKNTDVSLLCVQIDGNTMYSLPKGKIEPDETYLKGAIREVLEETGLDFSQVISEQTPFVIVMKTKLYIVYTDELITEFTNYNKYEVTDIKWFNLNYILQHTSEFSKQVYLAVKCLNL